MKTCSTCGYAEKDNTSAFCTNCGVLYEPELPILFNPNLKKEPDDYNKWDTLYYFSKKHLLGRTVILLLFAPFLIYIAYLIVLYV